MEYDLVKIDQVKIEYFNYKGWVLERREPENAVVSWRFGYNQFSLSPLTNKPDVIPEASELEAMYEDDMYDIDS